MFDAVDQLTPDLVIVDSVQTLFDPDVSGSPGSVTQIRECVGKLVQFAKSRELTVVLAGQVTKEGDLAGPRTLEHVVDTVIALEGDRHHAVRLVRVVKHRFGPSGEVGMFDMQAAGLIGVADPSAYLLTDRMCGVAGSAVVATLEGSRPVLAEVQALTARSVQAYPRRSGHGIDASRLAMLVAVIEQRAGVSLCRSDIYVSSMGGLKLSEPGTDLGICLAIASATLDLPIPPDVLLCAEVGLAGELRQVPNTERRLLEAARLGFRRVIVPTSVDLQIANLQIDLCRTLSDALRRGLSAPQVLEQPDHATGRHDHGESERGQQDKSERRVRPADKLVVARGSAAPVRTTADAGFGRRLRFVKEGTHGGSSFRSPA